MQQALVEQKLDALFAYTSFARPAAVSWLTHFIPYWSEALVAVLPEGAPLLLPSLSNRVYPWIREVSHVGEVRLGAEDWYRVWQASMGRELP